MIFDAGGTFDPAGQIKGPGIDRGAGIRLRRSGGAKPRVGLRPGLTGKGALFVLRRRGEA